MTMQIRTVAIAAVASAAHLSSVKKEERLGSLVRRDDYFRPAFRQANCPVIGTVDNNRTAFVVRFDDGDGIGQDFITIDQAADAASALLQVGEQVIVTLVDDVHIEDTVRGTYTYTSPEGIDQATIDNGKILRQAEYVDGKNRRCLVTLALIGNGPSTQMICVEQIAA
ncbi:MAG: hypothetical protein WCT03_27670 [Candidatus Obscuribacterales bacterium]|jgi:hypothetical protein